MAASPKKFILIAARVNDSPTLERNSYHSNLIIAISAPFFFYWPAKLSQESHKTIHNQNIAYFAKISNFLLFFLLWCIAENSRQN